MKLGEKGFSLIEIVVAISNLGVVAAAALPKAAHVLAVSRTQRVVSDLQTLDAAVIMYETEHGEQPKSIDDLSDYVQNVKKVKPPQGSKVIINSGEIEVKKGEYLLKKGDDGLRATLDDHTADEFMPGGASTGEKK